MIWGEISSGTYTLRLWGMEIDHIGIEMLKRASISGSLKPISIILDNRELIAQYEINSHISLKYLLSNRQFNKSKFKQLLKSYKAILAQMDMYMFAEDQLLVDINNIFYDSSSDEFLWIIAPSMECNEEAKQKLLNLIRILILENQEQYNELVIRSLNLNSFSVDNLLGYLENQKFINEDKYSFIKNIKDLFKNGRFCKKTRQNNIRKKIHEGENIIKRETLDISMSKTLYIKRFPMLICRENPSIYYSIYYDNILLGRGSSCDIVIENEYISREHAKIYRNDNEYKIRLLDNTNLTFLNSEIIAGERLIKNGDCLRVGGLELIFIQN